LAFDERGYRLGYGGGFYDRTLELLRKNKDVIAIGVGVDGQKIDTVPIGQYDLALDYVITEKNIYTTGK
jgi:5-formyltetrahydrofolate cyclo-ligase